MAGPLKSNLFLGLAAGVAGTALMDVYWKGMRQVQPQSSSSHREPPTVQVARRAMRRVGIRSPSKRTRAVGAQVVHWSYGTDWGLAVGVARAAGIRLDWGGGLLFGAGLWALGDLWMLYRLDLAQHPREYPVAVHATALGAHLVYGLGVWATIEGLQKLTGQEPRRLRRAA